MKKILLVILFYFLIQGFSTASEQVSYNGIDNYLRTIEQKIYKNYNSGNKNASGIATITINKDGSLAKSEITQSSGIKSLDKSINKAIQNTAPFAPLPSEFKGENLEINLAFSDCLSANVIKQVKANDTNNFLQQEFENKELKINYLYIPILIKQEILEDYEMYKNNKNSDTIYKRINDEAYKLSKNNDYNSKLNYKYLIEAKNNIFDFCNNRNTKKIMISDDKYAILTDKTKAAVSTSNLTTLENTETINIQLFNKSVNDITKQIKTRFLQDKNNIKQNYHFVDYINDSIIGELLDKVIPLAKSGQVQAEEKKYDITNILNNAKVQFENLAKEISDYSYNYEYKKYNNWIKQNNKKVIVDKLVNAVYHPYFQPKDGLYQYTPSRFEYPLQVLQTIPGGVIVSGVASMTPSVPNYIFLQTSKQYADLKLLCSQYLYC